jgi:hypothetical protein
MMSPQTLAVLAAAWLIVSSLVIAWSPWGDEQ